jgi:hypothetical protein
MADVTLKNIEEMEPIYGGLARRARAELGVTASGMQVFTLPPDWDGYPNHNHGSRATPHHCSPEELSVLQCAVAASSTVYLSRNTVSGYSASIARRQAWQLPLRRV